MSDVWQGPGWWLASDGKWYPADAEPGAVYEGDLPQSDSESTEAEPETAVADVEEEPAVAPTTPDPAQVAAAVEQELASSGDQVAPVEQAAPVAAAPQPQTEPLVDASTFDADPFAQMPAPAVEESKIGGWQAISGEEAVPAPVAEPATPPAPTAPAPRVEEEGWTSAYEERQEAGDVLEEPIPVPTAPPADLPVVNIDPPVVEPPDAPIADVPAPPMPAPEVQMPAPATEMPAPEVQMPAPAAEMPAPEVQMPAPAAEMPAPEVQMPAVEIPATPEAPPVEMPTVETPAAHIPDVATPEVQIPDVATPEVQIPDVATPEVQIPDVAPPEVQIPDVAAPQSTLIDAPLQNRDQGTPIERNDAWRKPSSADMSPARPDAPMPVGVPDVVDLAIPEEPPIYQPAPDGRNWRMLIGIAVGVIAIAGLAWLIASLFSGDDNVETGDTTVSSESTAPAPDSEAASTPATEPDDTNVSVFALRAGDCIVGDIGAGQVTKVSKVDCEVEHQFEVYREALIDSSITIFDEEAISSYAEEVCRTSLEAYIPDDDERGLKFKFLQPTEDSWNQTEDPDRVITCLLFDDDAALVGRAA